MRMNKLSFLACHLLLVVSCSPHQQRGAAYGALGGAAIGAVAGDDRRDVIRGAAIGAAVGTGIAAATEPTSPGQPDNRYGNEGGYDQAPAPAPARQPSGPGSYPYAEKTSNADQVISPYPPYNVIDVAGFRSGQLARDPSNQKIFRIP